MFSPTIPAAQAHLRLDNRLLAALLHLPEGILITSVRQDPTNAHNILIDLDGAVPAAGELVADYKSEWIKNVKLRGLKQVQP